MLTSRPATSAVAGVPGLRGSTPFRKVIGRTFGTASSGLLFKEEGGFPENADG
jgi:hypothetical protein